MTCSKCKKEFMAGNRPDGIPNGVGFEMEDGTLINLCCDCIMELGALDDKSQEEFINDLIEEVKNGR